MGYTLEITGTDGTYTFPVTTIFPSKIRNTFNGKGCLTEQVETITVEGLKKGSGPDPSDAFDDLDELRDLALRDEAQIVVIKLDAVEVRRLDPADVIDGPYITDFEEIPSPGHKANHTRFRFTIQVTLAGEDLGGVPVTNVDRSIEREIDNHSLIRQTWRISVQARSLAEAESLVNGFKPNVTPLREVYLKKIDQNTYEAVYTWERPKDEAGKLMSLSETMRITSGGSPIIPVRITGYKPVLRRGQLREWRIEFETVRKIYAASFEEARAQAGVVLHYPEENLDPTLSDLDSDPMLVDSVKGVYEWRTKEHYVFDEQPDPPDHGGHLDPAVQGDSPIPPDGNGFDSARCS